MESQNPPPQTQGGNMETAQGPIAQKQRLLLPLLSTLLADKSLDHVGAPISVNYRWPGSTRASAHRRIFGRLSMDDLDAIHFDIAPAAVYWELEYGKNYQYEQSPVPHDHPGLRDAKIVPVRLNLSEGENINSFAGEKALCNNDFAALSPLALPREYTPQSLVRWRIYDTHSRLRENYPAHYLVWEDPDSKDLYARVPRPLEGMSRAFCDHCRIHDPELAEEDIEYMDERPHVEGIRAMSAGDTPVTPMNLCRFHWWYVWSGELLRQSQVFALEVLVSGDLRERWGVSHMREFLLSMECHSPNPDQLSCDNPRRRPRPNPERELEVRLYMIYEMIWQSITNRMLKATGRRVAKSRLPEANGATVASTDAQETAVDGEQAGGTTADGLYDTLGPAGPPFTNGNTMPTPSHASAAGAGIQGQPAPKANGLSRTVAPGPSPQNNGGPAPRDDGFFRSPPKGPRAWLKKATEQARANNLAQNSGNSRGFIPGTQPYKGA